MRSVVAHIHVRPKTSNDGINGTMPVYYNVSSYISRENKCAYLFDSAFGRAYDYFSIRFSHFSAKIEQMWTDKSFFFNSIAR